MQRFIAVNAGATCAVTVGVDETLRAAEARFNRSRHLRGRLRVNGEGKWVGLRRLRNAFHQKVAEGEELEWQVLTADVHQIEHRLAQRIVRQDWSQSALEHRVLEQDGWERREADAARDSVRYTEHRSVGNTIRMETSIFRVRR